MSSSVILRYILSLLCLGFLTACGGGGGDDGPSRPTTGSIRVINGSTGFSMRELYVTRHDATTWGPNQLGSQSLGAGSALTLTQVEPGSFDLKAVWSDGVTAEKESVPVSAGVVIEVTMLDTGFLRLTNGDTFSLTHLYVSNSPTTWGNDLLGAPVAPGGTVTVPRLDPGYWDVRATWSDGAAYEELSLAVWADTTTALSLQPLSATLGAMRVTNGLATTMNELYVPGTATTGWGPNQLQGRPLAGGGSILLTDMPPDTYDVKGIWAGGASRESLAHPVGAAQTFNLILAPAASSLAVRRGAPEPAGPAAPATRPLLEEPGSGPARRAREHAASPAAVPPTPWLSGK